MKKFAICLLICLSTAMSFARMELRVPSNFSESGVATYAGYVG